MDLSSKENTLTPKRRRLGTGRILRANNHVFIKENTDILCSPLDPIVNSERCESPYLPCNQVEYSNNSSTSSEIPCSPGIMESSVIKNLENWDSLFVSRDTKVLNKPSVDMVEEIDDVSDEMFHTKLEQSMLHMNDTSKQLKEKLNDSFPSELCKNDMNKSSLFETRDSFLLDIKDSDVEGKSEFNTFLKPKIITEHNVTSGQDFYGLPMITKGLFKTYRNIEKFYDWQEECLNLDAIKERRNLIYALPTSGGKTLVAEVLMLREVINRKKNSLFILPFVAIVQEKIWSLSPFAVQLDFLVEEYAAGKGHIPPMKRRTKNSIYIATIEKGLALIRSLIELNRLDELGLIVVDELHLIGEKGRGGTLESLLSTVIFTNQNIQIVGMSATIGNLPELAQFLHAEVFQREFRPVELVEYVKLGSMLHRILWREDGVEIVPDREVVYDYSAAAASLDPDRLGGLVAEAVPAGGCLVFCPTKRNAENVAQLLCTLQRREMACHRAAERQALAGALRAEGAARGLARAARLGVGFHHAGLAGDERFMLEQAFRSGVVSVLCCTSTLAAGVNLPARRVVVRAPLVGRQFISLAAYRQMVGRAGRAGVCDTGESIIICGDGEWGRLRDVLCGGLGAARSVLACSPACVRGLMLSGVALRLAHSRAALRRLLAHTLLATHSSPVDMDALCDESIRWLVQAGALQASSGGPQLAVSKLGRAAIKGCLELSAAKQLMEELATASRALVLLGSLHLLYLVTPHDAAGLKPDYRHYYSLYCELDEEGVQTAKILGITEMNAIKMMTGKPITNVSENVLCRFYLALMLHDLWKQVPFPIVADKYCIPRGTVQSVMTSSCAFAACAQRFCEEMEPLWPFRALLAELAPRMRHAAAPALHQLMDLPGVKQARALQLARAGYKRVEDVARASVEGLVTSVAHLSRTAATHLISAARMTLIEKVENLRAEAENVMEDLNV